MHVDRLQENVERDGRSIMAEAAMMALAPRMGRDEAHAFVYEAARHARSQSISLSDALSSALDKAGLAGSVDLAAVMDPAAYVGNALRQAESAAGAWSSRRSGQDRR